VWRDDQFSPEVDGNFASSAGVYRRCRSRQGADTTFADSSEERVMDPLVTTTRLMLRDWADDDAPAALAIYGSAQVARWLTPAMDRIADVEAMRSVLQTWRDQQPGLLPPQGRWAIQRNADNVVIGGLGIGLLPPDCEDLEVSWQLNPHEWGKGYAAEAARELIIWAFTQEIDELFAVARPNNLRAVATVKRLGMQWVGETTKYYGLNMQVYRIRPNDFSG
jgi:RimJ/RimL family protein N-acetyltransferase